MNLDFCDMGFLSPTITFRVLDYLTIEDVVNLANTCQGLRMYILNLVVQKNFQTTQFVTFQNEDEEEAVELSKTKPRTGPLKGTFEFARRLAKHMNRRTLVRLLANFTEIIDHSQEKNHWKLAACPYNQIIDSKSVLLICCGILFSKVMGELSKEDLEGFISEVICACHLKEATNILMAKDYEVGSNSVVECKIRNFVYFCFWRKVLCGHKGSLEANFSTLQVANDDKGDILSSVLEVITDGCPCKKAMMIYLIFGPVKKILIGPYGEMKKDLESYPAKLLQKDNLWDVISWVMWEEVTHPYSTFQPSLKESFAPISSAIGIFFSSRVEYFNDHDYHCNFLQIINNLFEVGRNKWDVVNIATVLLSTTNNFREWFLINNQLVDTDDMEIVSNMVILAAKFQMPVESMSQLLHNIVGANLTIPSCRKLHMIESFWSELTECLQRLVNDDEMSSQGSYQSQVILFIAELGRKMMPIAYPVEKDTNSFSIGAKKRKIEIITFATED